MTRLSVNINKIATLRNSRDKNLPDVVKVALDCERFGAEGITVHPRPDERHIKKEDVYLLKKAISTELNIEGYPDKRYMDIISDTLPAQATLVPDAPSALTSDHGWDVVDNFDFLSEIVNELKLKNIRCSIFIDPNIRSLEKALEIGAARVELYTEPYANLFPINKTEAIKSYKECSEFALKNNIGLNAGHDLSLVNLGYFKKELSHLDEVSIGHALICDALYYGLENTIQLYLKELR